MADLGVRENLVAPASPQPKQLLSGGRHRGFQSLALIHLAAVRTGMLGRTSPSSIAKRFMIRENRTKKIGFTALGVCRPAWELVVIPVLLAHQRTRAAQKPTGTY